jgi:hypothetical protein
VSLRRAAQVSVRHDNGHRMVGHGGSIPEQGLRPQPPVLFDFPLSGVISCPAATVFTVRVQPNRNRALHATTRVTKGFTPNERRRHHG